jgi:flotillin
LIESGGAYLDLRRLELAPELTREIAGALANSQFVNFGAGSGGGDAHGAVATGSDDILRVVQTLMAAKVITGQAFGVGSPPAAGSSPPPPPQVRRREP